VYLHPVKAILQPAITGLGGYITRIARLVAGLLLSRQPSSIRLAAIRDTFELIQGAINLKCLKLDLTDRLGTGRGVRSSKGDLANLGILDGGNVSLPYIQIDEVDTQIRREWANFRLIIRQIWLVCNRYRLIGSRCTLDLVRAEYAVYIHAATRDSEIATIVSFIDLEAVTVFRYATWSHNIPGFRSLKMGGDFDRLVPIGVQVYPTLLFEYSRIALILVMSKAGNVCFHWNLSSSVT
jgi:hypothetical protein